MRAIYIHSICKSFLNNLPVDIKQNLAYIGYGETFSPTLLKMVSSNKGIGTEQNIITYSNFNIKKSSFIEPKKSVCPNY